MSSGQESISDAHSDQAGILLLRVLFLVLLLLGLKQMPP
jgi:hypothetical protein